MKNFDTKKLTMLGVICALAYVAVLAIRIPAVSFLEYEPKDVIILIGGFLFGPIAVILSSVVVSFIEMFTISKTEIYGLIMNILSTCAFACTAAVIYKKKKTIIGAAIGLIVGVLLMTVIMILWNYLIVPLYMNMERKDVVPMLLPVFTTFNLIKGGINAALAMLLYKPIITALRKTNLIETSVNSETKGKINIGVVIVSLFVLISCVLYILVLQGKI